ncbi:MAG: AMP-binding protein [Firmicutes bacterium]|nr:AMP-binding protein [Bacillota bacterium]
MKNFNNNQADATISQSLSYFSSILAGLETDSNPIYDFPQKISQQAAPNQSISSDFSRIFTPTALTALLATSKVSAKVFFLAAFSYSLAKFSGQDESLFCISPVDNRDRMLPLYLKINEDQRVFEYLDGVQTIYQETIRQTACSFEKLAAELDLKADLRFVFEAPSAAPPDLGHAHLAVVISAKGDSYEMRLHYRGDLYQEATIRSFADLFENTIRGFLSQSKLSEISLISAADQLRCDAFNRTAVAYDTSLTMVSMLRQQAKKTPDQVALVYQDIRLTYGQLDTVTDRLAKHIKSFGIGREDIVPILVAKSEFMTIAAIAVLKAGAAYQPLDPSYPIDRLGFMIKDTSARLLIADQAMLVLVPDYPGQVILT